MIARAHYEGIKRLLTVIGELDEVLDNDPRPSEFRAARTEATNELLKARDHLIAVVEDWEELYATYVEAYEQLKQ